MRLTLHWYYGGGRNAGAKQQQEISLSSNWSVSRETERKRMFHNCIDDGRRPTVHALQQECTNRLKVLCSKGKVLSV